MKYKVKGELKMKVGRKITEIEELPSEWNMVSTLDILLDTNNAIKIGPFGSQLKKEYLVDNGKKVYGQENVYNNDFKLGDRYVSESRFNKLKSCQIKSGNVVISMMGTIGKCAIVPDGIEEGIMDSHLIKLEINDKKFSKEFFKHLMDSQIIKRQIKKLSVGGIMDGLSSTIIKQLKYPSPPLPEQKKIADILFTVDQQIEQTDALIDKTKELKKGLMQKLLTKGIGHTEFKKTEVGEIPVEWEVKQVSEVADINPNYKLAKGEIYDYVEMAALPNESKTIQYLKNREYGVYSGSKFKNGDTLFARITPCTENGKMAFVDNLRSEYGLGSTEFIVLSPKRNYIEPAFLFYFFKSPKVRNYAINRMIGTTGRQRVPKEVFKEELMVVIPCIQEQKKIAAILLNIDEKIAQYTLKKQHLQSLKRGLMQKLLTGKIRVKVSEEG